MRAAWCLSLVMAAAACGKSHTPAAASVDGSPINAAVHALADRVCGCNNDLGCVKQARIEWDAGKKNWLEQRASFTPGTAIVFDSEAGRMAACGDAAGVTFWRQL